jgi:hypothetical protein
MAELMVLLRPGILVYSGAVGKLMMPSEKIDRERARPEILPGSYSCGVEVRFRYRSTRWARRSLEIKLIR